ncbi:MAG TPA: WXG100 family type VII secretion target [Pseudonocardiaceae bacterium]
MQSPNGAELTAPVNGHLDYLSQLAKHLGVPDPVETYLVPVLGRWRDLHDEAGRWRSVAVVASDVTARLSGPLAGLDAAWQGADANSFLDYMHAVGLAGHDMADALTGMADALDKTANGIRQIAGELVDILAGAAEQTSDCLALPSGGEARARQHLAELESPGRQLYESVRDVLDAFVKLCDGVQGGQLFDQITMAHKMPTQNWAPPAVTAPAPLRITPQPPVTPPAPVAPPATAPQLTAPPVATPAAASAPAVHHGGVPAHAAAVAAHQAPSPGSASAAVVNSASTSPPTVPGSAPPATAGSPATGGGGMPMGGMGGMGGGRGGDAEHKTKIRTFGDPREIFGTPDHTAPRTIGEE